MPPSGDVVGRRQRRTRDVTEVAATERDHRAQRRAMRHGMEQRGLEPRRPVGTHGEDARLGGTVAHAVERRRGVDQPARGRTRGDDRPVPVDDDGRAVDRELARAGDHQCRDERSRRRVLDLHHQVAVPAAEHPMDRVATRNAHRGLHDRHVVDQRLTHGDFAPRHVPAVVGADPPAERPGGAIDGELPVVIDARGSGYAERTHQLGAAVHCSPCSSGLAWRNISSGTRSAGRRPS